MHHGAVLRMNGYSIDAEPLLLVCLPLHVGRLCLIQVFTNNIHLCLAGFMITECLHNEIHCRAIKDCVDHALEYLPLCMFTVYGCFIDVDLSAGIASQQTLIIHDLHELEGRGIASFFAQALMYCTYTTWPGLP